MTTPSGLAPATHALTLWQPYAWGISDGGKDVENRPIPPPRARVGQRLAIHAAKAIRVEYETVTAAKIERRTGVKCPGCGTMDRSAVVAVVTLVSVLDARDDKAMDADLARKYRWWEGPVGLVLADVVRIEPVPVASDDGFHRGYWVMSVAVAAAVERAVQTARKNYTR